MAQTNSSEESKVNALEKKVQYLELGVWFSAASFLCAAIGLVLRFFITPTLVVANPPTSLGGSWKMGPATMLTLDQVAKEKNTTTEEIRHLILLGLIDPKPLLLEESNITWAIYPDYTIKKLPSNSLPK